MKNLKKNISIVIIASLTIIMFVGCSSYKKVGNSSNSDTTNNTGTSMTDTGTQKTKELYSNTLKPLVTAGTITQNQSDKVITAITKDMSNDTETTDIGTPSPGTPRTITPGKNAPSTGTPSIGTPGVGSPATPVTGITGAKMKPNISELNALVRSGVITQAQANAINQKIQEAIISNQTE